MRAFTSTFRGMLPGPGERRRLGQKSSNRLQYPPAAQLVPPREILGERISHDIKARAHMLSIRMRCNASMGADPLFGPA